jgi:2-phospho-L-lactate guanylyltransferase
MIYKALVPVKSLASAKSRLAPYLTQNQRETLVLDMLHHVLEVLLDSRLLEQVSVVSPDKRVLERAEEWGAQALMEEVRGHNPALQAAAMKELNAGTTALLTISADLPLLHTGDIRALIERSLDHQIVLAASRDRTGTNAILMRPPLALPYLFGPNSLQSYLQAARQRKLSNIIYNSVGLALDIDTIDDLDDLYELQALSGEAKQYEICSSQV